MASSIDLQLNLHNTLNRDLDRAIMKMDSFNDKLFKSDLMSGNISRKWSRSNDLLAGGTRTFGKLLNISKSLVPAIGTIFGGGLIIQGTRDIVKYSQSFREMAHQMGDGANASRQYAKTMADVSLATGLAAEDIGDLIINLRNLRVPMEGIERATLITARFSEATGISSTESARLYGEMMRVGRMSQEMTDSTMAGMALIQKQFGLSNREMDNMANNLITITQRMNQLGKSSAQTSRMTKGTVALAIAFSKVGLEADRALDFVDDLLNPERIEENALLYAKLGISISDAFAGNVDLIDMIPKMAELGQQMKDMSGPAAAAMAKSLGMPLNVLRQFGEIELGLEDQRELARLMGEEGMDAAAALKELHRETRGVDKIFAAIGNVLQSISSKVAAELGDRLSGVADTVKVMADEGKFDWIAGAITKSVEFLVNVPKYIPLIGVGLFALFKSVRRRAYSTFVEPIKDMTEELKTAMTGVLNMGKQRRGVIREEAVTPRREPREGIFSAEAIARRNKARDQENELLFAYSSAKKADLENTKDILISESETIEKRLDYFNKLRGQQVRLTFRQKAEELKLLTLGAKTRSQVEAADIAFRNAQILEERKRINLIKHGSEETILAIAREAQARAEANQKNIAGIEKEIADREKTLGENIKYIEILEREMATIKDAQTGDFLPGAEFRGEEYVRISEKVKELLSINKDLEDINEKQVIDKEKLLDKLDVEKKALEDIRTLRKDIDITAEADPTGHGTVLSRMLQTGDQLFRRMKIGTLNAVDQLRTSFSTFFTSLKASVAASWEFFKERPLKAAFTAGAKTLGAPLKYFGNVLKDNLRRVIGPMALMTFAMKMLQPVVEGLKPAFEIITETFSGVLSKLFETVVPPFLRIAAALVPLLSTMVNYLLPPIISALGGVITAAGWVVETAGKVLGLFSKKTGETVEAIGKELYETGKETFTMGFNMFKKENQIISRETAKAIQDSLINTADKITSGELVFTTKPESKDFKGGTVYLDEEGNIRLDKGNLPKDKKEQLIPGLDNFLKDMYEISSKHNASITTLFELVTSMNRVALEEEIPSSTLKDLLTDFALEIEKQNINLSDGNKLIEIFNELAKKHGINSGELGDVIVEFAKQASEQGKTTQEFSTLLISIGGLVDKYDSATENFSKAVESYKNEDKGLEAIKKLADMKSDKTPEFAETVTDNADRLPGFTPLPEYSYEGFLKGIWDSLFKSRKEEPKERQFTPLVDEPASVEEAIKAYDTFVEYVNKPIDGVGEVIALYENMKDALKEPVALEPSEFLSHFGYTEEGINEAFAKLPKPDTTFWQDLGNAFGEAKKNVSEKWEKFRGFWTSSVGSVFDIDGAAHQYETGELIAEGFYDHIKNNDIEFINATPAQTYEGIDVEEFVDASAKKEDGFFKMLGRGIMNALGLKTKDERKIAEMNEAALLKKEAELDRFVEYNSSLNESIVDRNSKELGNIADAINNSNNDNVLRNVGNEIVSSISNINNDSSLRSVGNDVVNAINSSNNSSHIVDAIISSNKDDTIKYVGNDVINAINNISKDNPLRNVGNDVVNAINDNIVLDTTNFSIAVSDFSDAVSALNIKDAEGKAYKQPITFDTKMLAQEASKITFNVKQKDQITYDELVSYLDANGVDRNIITLPDVTNIKDGIIYKDNKIVRTHEDDNIIATKNTPQVKIRTVEIEREKDNKKEMVEIISALGEILDSLQGVLNEGIKSSESLEKISNASAKTALNTKGSVAPKLEVV